MTLDRRSFLRGAAGTLGVTVGARALTAGQATADGTPAPAGPLPAVPFHGEHQAGILTPPPPAATFAVFDVTSRSLAELRALFTELTEQARYLTSGGTPADLGVGSPPSDSGLLGPVVPSDGLTITVGVGASLFDHRFGLAVAKPRHLVPMRTFPMTTSTPPSATATCRSRSAPAATTRSCTLYDSLPSTPAAPCSSSTASTDSSLRLGQPVRHATCSASRTASLNPR